MEQGRYSEVIECLEKILNTPEDCLFPPEKSGPLNPGLKDTAQRLIGEMPREGRQLYQLLYGHEAQSLLAEVLASGDATKLAEVSARFLHTRAGYEAMFLLGLYHLDHGRPLEAALELQALRAIADKGDRFEPALTLAMATGFLESGEPKGPEEARKALLALKQQRPALAITIGGRQIGWFEKDADALTWLTQLVGQQRAPRAVEADRWLMDRGDPGATLPASALPRCSASVGESRSLKT